MARTNATAVEGILLENYERNDDGVGPNLKPFIDIASTIVARMVTCATAKGITFTTSELTEIEKWLAAHFYQQADRGYTSRTTASASGSFQGQTAMQFESTMYGQSALLLDPSGCLAQIGKRKPQAHWLGKPPSDQIDYSDRD